MSVMDAMHVYATSQQQQQQQQDQPDLDQPVPKQQSPQPQLRVQPEDFELLRVIGQGGYGKVRVWCVIVCDVRLRCCDAV